MGWGVVGDREGLPLALEIHLTLPGSRNPDPPCRGPGASPLRRDAVSLQFSEPPALHPSPTPLTAIPASLGGSGKPDAAGSVAVLRKEGIKAGRA